MQYAYTIPLPFLVNLASNIGKFIPQREFIFSPISKAVSALENSDPIKQFDGFHRGFDCNGPNAIITCVKCFLDCYPEYTSTQEFSNAIACYQKMLNDIQVYNSFIYNYNSIVTSKGYDIVAPSGALKPLSVD